MLVGYRRKLEKHQIVIVRYINENIELKQKLRENNLTYNIGRTDYNSEELNRIIHYILKKTYFYFFFYSYHFIL